MAVGTQYTSPQEGYQRFDDSNLNIKYVGNWSSGSSPLLYNNSQIGTNEYVSYIEFYFYGTKLRIIDSCFYNRFKNIGITIDDNTEYYSTYDENITSSTSLTSQICVYEKENLERKIHRVKIQAKQVANDGSALVLDCIDIDEDGYMVYCDDNGELYYDVTPIMTSNTAPAPYVVSATSEYNSGGNYLAGYKAFNGSSLPPYGDPTGWYSNCWGYNNLTGNVLPQSLSLNFNKKVKVSHASIIARVSSYDTFVKSFYITNKEGDTLLTKTTEFTDWTSGGRKTFRLDKISSSSEYKITVTEQYNHGCIGELRYLLAEDTPFYLIYDNGVYKNYDEATNSLVTVSDTSILKEDAINNTCIYDLTKIVPHLDTLSDDFTILCNNDKKIIVKGIKSNKELIIGKNSFSTKIAKNIDYFQLDNEASAKIIFSVDGGVTWKTYNSSTNTFEDLSISIPVDKDYSDFTEEEKTAWDEAKEIAYNQGIDSSILNTINFNDFDYETMKFGYVLTATDSETMDKMTSLIWHFDSKGIMEVVDGDKVKQQLFYGGVKLISNIDTDMLKVNITYEGITGELPR